MTIVAGVDFGTLSVRVSIFDDERGRLGAGTADYPLQRSKADPNLGTQRHDDQMNALALATRRAIESAGIDGRQIAAIALDTTG
jgi:L-ribulokinase